MAFLQISDVRKQFATNIVVKGFDLGIGDRKSVV